MGRHANVHFASFRFNLKGAREICVSCFVVTTSRVFLISDPLVFKRGTQQQHFSSAGGDGQTQDLRHDAEIYSQTKSLEVHGSEVGGWDLLYENFTAFDRWLIMKLQSQGLAAFSDRGLRFRTHNLNQLQFSGPDGMWYLGINRVVEPHDMEHAIGNRDGVGLCSVCIRWSPVKNLAPPRQTPTFPDVVVATPEPKCLDSGSCEVCCEFHFQKHFFIGILNSSAKGPQSGLIIRQRCSLFVHVALCFTTLCVQWHSACCVVAIVPAADCTRSGDPCFPGWIFLDNRKKTDKCSGHEQNLKVSFVRPFEVCCASNSVCCPVRLFCLDSMLSLAIVNLPAQFFMCFTKRS